MGVFFLDYAGKIKLYRNILHINSWKSQDEIQTIIKSIFIS